MADQEQSTGTERASDRSESTTEQEGSRNAGEQQGLSGKASEIFGGLEEVGAGLVVGATAYTDGVTAPNPYYQYGTVDTGGYGGPPNIGAVSHVFAKARHDALVFAGQVVDDTTGNAASYGQGVGTGLAPELVTMSPLTGVDARNAQKASVDAAAAYQTAHPVMLHFSDEQLAAAQPADEYGNPLDEDAAEDAAEGSASSSGDADYSDHSDRASQGASQGGAKQSEQASQAKSGQAQSGPARTEEPGRRPVDPTRGQQGGQGSGSQASNSGQPSSG